MFRHAYNGYMMHAFPLDELDPVRCKGVGLSRLRRSDQSYHIRGGLLLTLVDSLSTVAVIGDQHEFHRAVRTFLDNFQGFDTFDNLVLTFEVNIRVLAGLLSAHQLLSDRRSPLRQKGYCGELLQIAKALGGRLMPAFDTPTGLPFSLVNLKSGRTGSFNTTCSAAAGTFLLEFGLLSDLTLDDRFRRAAVRASDVLWSKRSAVGLVGNEINVNTGAWVDEHSTIGAGTDSFYEYLLKYSLYSGDEGYYRRWTQAWRSIKRHLIDDSGFPRVVARDNGARYPLQRIDSLAAFLPGLLALHGDTAVAEMVWDVYYALFLKYGHVPEHFDVHVAPDNSAAAPYFLRPEFIESTYYLYRATGRVLYKQVALRAVDALNRCCRTRCGYAALDDAADFRSKAPHMDSFFLAETLKYLYLILDEQHWMNDAPIVFTTEAHPIFLRHDAVTWVRMKECKVERRCLFRHDPERAARRLGIGETVNSAVLPDDYLHNWDDRYASAARR